ncbi:YIP1 family protein [Aliidiomarina celeris]|uniref:YIP1 family protein n=1 Tax=Aliidiomarina celeris TaxID=2249428 RepID=UPI000DE8B845|nr:YIP1 family protein [Aliidiomarina celeris]
MIRLREVLSLPFSAKAGWPTLIQVSPSIPTLAWLLVLPMALLPPVLLYYAGTHYGDEFIQGFHDRNWRFFTTTLFMAQLLTFFVMGWLIQAVSESHKLGFQYAQSYLIAALAPLPLWLSSLVLLIPIIWVNAFVGLAGFLLSSGMVFNGIRAMTHEKGKDTEAMSTAIIVISASLIAWILLLVLIWAF